MIVDAWMRHPTARFLSQPWLASLKRWTGNDHDYSGEPPLGLTRAAMAAGARRAGIAVRLDGSGVAALTGSGRPAAVAGRSAADSRPVEDNPAGRQRAAGRLPATPRCRRGTTEHSCTPD